jgi:hypothetical protein
MNTMQHLLTNGIGNFSGTPAIHTSVRNGQSS